MSPHWHHPAVNVPEMQPEVNIEHWTIAMTYLILGWAISRLLNIWQSLGALQAFCALLNLLRWLVKMMYVQNINDNKLDVILINDLLFFYLFSDISWKQKVFEKFLIYFPMYSVFIFKYFCCISMYLHLNSSRVFELCNVYGSPVEWILWALYWPV